MNRINYPKPPKRNVRRSREMYVLDYKKLIDERLVPFRPHNEFVTLNNVKIGGIGTCEYYGQVDPESGKPDGLGIAVNYFDNIREGGFQNGESVPTYRKVLDGPDCVDIYINFSTENDKDDREYQVYL